MQNLGKREEDLAVKPQIQFISGFEEGTVPRRVKLTKSENGETGTATFLFFKPTVFSLFSTINLEGTLQIRGMDLLWDKKKITSKDIKIFFYSRKTSSHKNHLYF